jgi:sugar phosphate permease
MNDLSGVYGWNGWQWMFLIEGLPAVVLGLLVLKVLDDYPTDAKWLSTRDKELLARALADDKAGGAAGAHTLGQALRDPKVYILAFAYFTFIAGTYVITFWLPTMVKSLGVVNNLHIGLLTAIPYVIGAAGMILLSKNSDRPWNAAGTWHCRRFSARPG